MGLRGSEGSYSTITGSAIKYQPMVNFLASHIFAWKSLKRWCADVGGRDLDETQRTRKKQCSISQKNCESLRSSVFDEHKG